MIEGVGGSEHTYRGCEVPPELLYDVERDVWIRPDDDGSLTLGMTDPAQSRAGKFLHIQFKKVGRHLDAGQSAATVETAKWAGPFPTPVGGTVLETNEHSFAADVLIANRDPYGAGWIVRLRPDAWPPPTDLGLVTGPEALTRYETRIDQLGLSCIRCAESSDGWLASSSASPRVQPPTSEGESLSGAEGASPRTSGGGQPR